VRDELRRRLGTTDAVVVGLGAMLGAGIFAGLAPAAAAAGSALLVALGVAAVVAVCNALSTARLAARHPQSGGTYVYGRERLGPLWGLAAGWAFVVGKTASCAAMGITVGHHLWPAHPQAGGVLAVLALASLSLAGVERSARVSRWLVAIVLVVLAAVVLAAWLGSGERRAPAIASDLDARGTLEAAGLLFFAFAGYARIATLGEEVRDPERTIVRAVPIALGAVLAIYLLVAASALAVLGAGGLAASPAPLVSVVDAAGAPGLEPVVRAGAAAGALGALLALLLGVSRTTLAMARDGHLPRALATVHEATGVPRHAELTIAAIVVLLVATVDLRGAIGFSSFGVLAYYAIANASAWRLRPDEGRLPRAIPAVGLVGCVVLALALPASSVLAGAGVIAVGLLVLGPRARTRG
jgi:APA family basic amino acid/polyamine antiporter